MLSGRCCFFVGFVLRACGGRQDFRESLQWWALADIFLFPFQSPHTPATLADWSLGFLGCVSKTPNVGTPHPVSSSLYMGPYFKVVHSINNPHPLYVKSPRMGSTSRLAVWALLCPFYSAAQGAGLQLLSPGWRCGRGIPQADNHQGHICLYLMFKYGLKAVLNSKH